MPFSSLERMLAELSWMYLNIFEGITEVYEEYEEMYEWLKYGDSPRPPKPFDPFQTIRL
jgi:hypothetical protein